MKENHGAHQLKETEKGYVLVKPRSDRSRPAWLFVQYSEDTLKIPYWCDCVFQRHMLIFIQPETALMFLH